MKLKVLKIWSVVSTILVIIIVLFALFLMGSRIMGYRVFNVTSGSMSPTYEVGVPAEPASGSVRLCNAAGRQI